MIEREYEGKTNIGVLGDNAAVNNISSLLFKASSYSFFLI